MDLGSLRSFNPTRGFRIFCGEVPQKVIAKRKNPCIIPQPVDKVPQNPPGGSVKTEAIDLRF